MDRAVKTVAYLRVSTPQHDVSSQRLAILEYARAHDFRIDDFIEATASGQASELTHVLQRGDRLVVSELGTPPARRGCPGGRPQDASQRPPTIPATTRSPYSSRPTGRWTRAGTVRGARAEAPRRPTAGGAGPERPLKAR